MTRRVDEELLALVLDPLDDVPVVGLDSEGHVVRWTAGAERTTGFCAAEVLSKHVSELYLEEDIAAGRPSEDLRRAEEHGYSVTDGWRRRADGSRFWARVVLRSRRDAEGKLAGFVKLTCDLTDQLEVQRSLAASDQLFAGIVELATDGIVSTDAHGRIILFNRGAELLFGYDRHEVIGEPIGILLPESKRWLHAEHTAAFASGDRDAARMSKGRVVAALTKDGREFPVEASISRLTLDDGSILTVILRDASETEAVEAALVDRLARAQRLADALPVPIALFDRRLRYQFANQAAAEWIGRATDELRQLSLRKVTTFLETNATLDAAMPEIEAALRGEVRRFSGRARRHDGNVRDIETTFIPSWDEAGDVDGVYAVTLDITEGRRNEVTRDVLTATKSLLAESLVPDLAVEGAVLLAASGFSDRCVAFITRDDGCLTRFSTNDGASGSSAEPIAPANVPPTVAQVMYGGHPTCYTDLTDQAAYVVVPVPCAERDGGAVLFGWNPPFDMGRGELEVAEDLGARLAGAIDRIELSRRTSQAVRGRDWLLQKVTHDLGNPVASIVMGVDRILRDSPIPDRRERTRSLLDGIAQQSREMQLIVEELLDASALRTGRASIRARPMNSARIMSEVVSLGATIARVRKVALSLEVPEQPPVVLADSYHLRRSLMALLSDAISRCEPGQSVRLAVSTSKEDVFFEVSGPGLDFSRDELMKLLDEGRPEDAREAGTRLSLPLLIGNEIVQAHGSRLEVLSDPVEETTYAFSLPIVP